MIWSFGLTDGFFCISATGKGGICLNIGANLAGELPTKTQKKYAVGDRFIVEYGLRVDEVTDLVQRTLVSKNNNNQQQKGLSGATKAGDPSYLLDLIKDGKLEVLFFTGAGLSRDAGIWGSAELWKQLQLDDIARLCWYCVSKPDELIGRFKMFTWQMLLAKPTKAHEALALIVRQYKRIVVTENLDRLHELTGITPYRPFEEKALASLYTLKPDIIVALGSGFSMAGSLLEAWQNKGARIHLISRGLCSFQHLVDFVYRDDLQVCLPGWQKMLGLDGSNAD